MLTKKDVEVLSKSTLYSGFFQMKKYCFRHRLFAGGWSNIVSREVFERGDAIVVLPYDPILDNVVLVEQIRFPALIGNSSPWLLELVAGIIEPNEIPVEVAQRELLEETGLTTTAIYPVTQYFSSPGGSSEQLYFYWAKIDSTLAAGIHGLSHEDEDIKVHVISRNEAYKKVESGEINNAATIIGLQWLQLNAQKLKKIT